MSLNYREAKAGWLSDKQATFGRGSGRRIKPVDRYGVAATEEDLIDLESDEDSGRESQDSASTNFSGENQDDAPRQKDEATSIEMLVNFMSAIILGRWEIEKPTDTTHHHITNGWEYVNPHLLGLMTRLIHIQIHPSFPEDQLRCADQCILIHGRRLICVRA